MKRKFALPIAVALILHAALWFGFGSTPEAVARGELTGCLGGIDDMPTTIEIVDFPQLVESPVGADSKAEVQGDPDAQNVSLPDFLQPVPTDYFTIPVEPFEAISHEKMTRIKSGIRGAIDGVEGGDFRTGSPISSSILDSSPRAIVQTSPRYPGEAKIQGIEGLVLVGFTVDEAGQVNSPYVINSTDRRFEEEAVRAVSHWRFEPGRRLGRVVRFRMAVPIVFSLND